MNKSVLILPVIVVAIAAIMSSIFIVDEREKALILRFGRVVQVQEDPGIGFRVPFVDQVVTYDDRIISIDMEAQEVIPNDEITCQSLTNVLQQAQYDLSSTLTNVLLKAPPLPEMTAMIVSITCRRMLNGVTGRVTGRARTPWFWKFVLDNPNLFEG